jgi:hypothetical protein
MIDCKIRTLKEKVGKIKHDVKTTTRMIEKLRNMDQSATDKYGMKISKVLLKNRLKLEDLNFELKKTEKLQTRLKAMEKPVKSKKPEVQMDFDLNEPETKSDKIKLKKKIDDAIDKITKYIESPSETTQERFRKMGYKANIGNLQTDYAKYKKMAKNNPERPALRAEINKILERADKI